MGYNVVMQFFKVSSSEPVVAFLVRRLTEKLKSGKVLWLVAGGSAIPIVIDVAKRLPKENLRNLTFSLTDERFGPVGHGDSNWQQLLDGGLELASATLLPVLTGQAQNETAAAWGKALDAAWQGADYRLGFFGVGPDGHIAGVLPHSSVVEAKDTVVSYQSEAIPGVRPAFQRISLSLPGIARLDEAVVYAVGEAKWPVLDQLETTDLPLAEQPAQILKRIPVVSIFNDHKGETR